MLELFLATIPTLPILFLFVSFVPLVLHYEERWNVEKGWSRCCILTLSIWGSAWITGGIAKELMEHGMGGTVIFQIATALFVIIPSSVTAIISFKLFMHLAIPLRVAMTSAVCLITHPVLGAAIVLKYVAMHRGSTISLWDFSRAAINPLWMAWKPNWLDLILSLILCLVVWGVYWAGTCKKKRILPLLASFSGVFLIMCLVVGGGL